MEETLHTRAADLSNANERSPTRAKTRFPKPRERNSSPTLDMSTIGAYSVDVGSELLTANGRHQMNTTSRINTLITAANLNLDMGNIDGAYTDIRAARTLIADADKTDLAGVDFAMLTAVDARRDTMNRAAINDAWAVQADAEMNAGVDR